MYTPALRRLEKVALALCSTQLSCMRPSCARRHKINVYAGHMFAPSSHQGELERASVAQSVCADDDFLIDEVRALCCSSAYTFVFVRYISLLFIRMLHCYCNLVLQIRIYITINNMSIGVTISSRKKNKLTDNQIFSFFSFCFLSQRHLARMQCFNYLWAHLHCVILSCSVISFARITFVWALK